MQISFFKAAKVMPAIVTLVHQQHQEYQQNPKQDASNSPRKLTKLAKNLFQQRKTTV
jgi:hypothetical protein